MDSRTNRYYEELDHEVVSSTRSSRNKRLYMEVNGGYSDLENLPILDNTDEIDMDDDSLLKMGINQSKLHVDFMIGTKDLSIVGTTYDGREISIFENGNFSCEIIGEEEKC